YSQPSQVTSYVPTPAEINGDFSATSISRTANQIFNPFSSRAGTGGGTLRDPFYCDSSGQALPADPATRLQLPKGTGNAPPAGTQVCNKIPGSLINPAMQAFFKAYAPALNY